MATHLNTGGITSYLLILSKEQTKAGHEVYIWASAGERSGDFRPCSAGIVPDVPRCKSELSPNLWTQLPKLVSFLKKNPVDIIHCHTRVAQVLAAAAGFFVKTPYVSTAHMLYKKRLGRRLFPCWGKAVIAISRAMQEGLLEVFGRENLPLIEIVLNGIDIGALRARIDQTDREAVRKSYGYASNHLVVASMARLIPVKGAHLLVEAFAIARKKVPHMRLLLGGSGEDVYVQNLKRRVTELGLETDVLFLGNVTEIEKPLKATDIFVAPYVWEEAFGIAVLEAMIAGQAIIGAKSGSVPELLDHGRRGLLFEKGDVEALAELLIKLSEDVQLRKELGMAAMDGAEEYSSAHMGEGVQKVYEEVLKHRL
ncbi:MAG: glycosyltransferase family 4 protein [Candidatus Omnitrophota bacterium]